MILMAINAEQEDSPLDMQIEADFRCVGLCFWGFKTAAAHLGDNYSLVNGRQSAE